MANAYGIAGLASAHRIREDAGVLSMDQLKQGLFNWVELIFLVHISQHATPVGSTP